MIGPVGADQRGHVDVLEDWPLHRPVLVIEDMAISFRQEILRQRETPIAPSPDPHPEPRGHEPRLGYAAVERELSIEIGDSLPRHDRAQVGWLEGGHVP